MIPMKDFVDTFLEKGRVYTTLGLELDRLKSELEYKAREEIKKISGLRAFISIQYNEVALYVSDFKGVSILECGGWGERDPEDDHPFGRPVPEGPMTWSEFDLLMKDLAAKIGCPLVYSTLQVRTEGSIANIAALRLMHPGKTITQIAEGQVRYVGWDISDRWYEATLDDEYWAFWEEGGHGGGITRSAKKGTSDWALYEAFRESGD